MAEEESRQSPDPLERKLHEPAFTLPTSLEELTIGCLTNAPVGDNMELFPGFELMQEHQELFAQAANLSDIVKGRFGLHYVDPLSRRPTARLGYIVLPGDQERGVPSILYISHTPQGLPPEEMTQSEGRRLYEIDYRRRMVRKVIDMGIAMNLDLVGAMRSSFNEKVLNADISEDFGKRAMDYPFKGKYHNKEFKYIQGSGLWVYSLK